MIATFAGDNGENQRTNFTTVCPSIEGVARQVMLLAITMDSSRLVEERLHLFLELFGNAQIQPKTQRYLKQLTKCMIEVLTEEEGP